MKNKSKIVAASVLEIEQEAFDKVAHGVHHIDDIVAEMVRIAVDRGITINRQIFQMAADMKSAQRCAAGEKVIEALQNSGIFDPLMAIMRANPSMTMGTALALLKQQQAGGGKAVN